MGAVVNTRVCGMFSTSLFYRSLVMDAWISCACSTHECFYCHTVHGSSEFDWKDDGNPIISKFAVHYSVHY